MRKSTRTLIALTAAVSFTAAACGSDETPVDDTVVEDTDEVVDSIVEDTDEVVDSVVEDTDEVVDSVVEAEVVTTEG